MRLIGIDCATKSLAVSIVDFNSDWASDLSKIRKKYTKLYETAETIEEKISVLLKRVNSVKTLWDTMFILRYVNVFDLLPGVELKGASIELKMSRLKAALHYVKCVNLKMEHSVPINKVLIEYQMSANDKSRTISNALVYAFTEPDHNFTFSGKYLNLVGDSSSTSLQTVTPGSTVEIVGPALKSKVYFGADGKMSNFRKKYMSNYTANKAHAKHNFKEWISLYDCSEIIEGIPTKNLDDVADSFLMTYAWCVKHFTIM
jgi:hypothetical protein